MTYRVFRLVRDRRASTLVESALGLLAFLLILFAVFELGRLMWAYNLLTHATHDGIRYAMVRGNSSGQTATASTIASYVKSQAPGLGSSASTVAVTWSPDNAPGSSVNITYSYLFTPVLVPYLQGSLTLRAHASTVILR